MTADEQLVVPPDLRRLFNPRRVAVVGLSDKSVFTKAIEPLLVSGAEVFMVNPGYPTVMGLPSRESLHAIGGGVDAVLSLMSATRTADLVEQSADLDIGGFVIVAGGFGETGPVGADLERRIREVAQAKGRAVVGPNGLGYINVRRRIALTIANDHKRRPGGISVVSQSGAMLSGVAMAAWAQDRIGLNLLVSSGNETALDVADYVSFLAEDEETTAIGLIIEQIRRPAEFLAAVGKAAEADKPVVALKLARTDRSRKMASSHTGALTGDAWVYDVAFAQSGVVLARDPEELIDRLSLAAQLDPSVWTSVERLGVTTFTGGFSSLAADIAAEESVPMPALEGMKDWLATILPAAAVVNPLDATGMGEPFWPEILERYGTSDQLDSLLYIHPIADEDDMTSARSLVGDFVSASHGADRPFVISNAAGAPGDFARRIIAAGAPQRGALAVGNGLRSSLRGLATIGAFVRHRDRSAARRPRVVVPVERPDSVLLPQPEGTMLGFADTMRLLEGAGIPVAPFAIVPPDVDPAAPAFDGPYVVKLADVAHRTEHDAVVLDVDPAGLHAAVARLRGIAERDGLPPDVAIQPMLGSVGEVFVGVQGRSEFGPLVVFGLGGVFVEVLRRVGGRLAPFDRSEAEALIAEFEDAMIMHGFRGRPRWDLEQLAELLVVVGRLAAGSSSWMSSLDINPMLYTGTGFVAVDALCLVTD